MSDFELVTSAVTRGSVKDLATLSKRAGVPFTTLYNIRRGFTKNPRIKTIEAVAKALREV